MGKEEEETETSWTKPSESESYGLWMCPFSNFAEFTFTSRKDLAPLKISQNSTGKGEIGSHIWGASFYLGHYMEYLSANDGNRFTDKTILELGSGIGMTGIIAAILGGEVTLTDKGPLLPLIENNINLAKQDGHQVKTHTKSLLWGEEKLNQKFEYIIGADLTYDDWLLDPLIETIVEHAFKETQIFIGVNKERAMTPVFIEKTQGHLKLIEEIPFETLQTMLSPTDELASFEIGTRFSILYFKVE